MASSFINQSKMDEQGEQVLATLREEFPTLTIEFTNNAICVRMPGFWAGIASKSEGWKVNERVKSILPNYVIFKALEHDLLVRDPSTRGAYLLINGPCSRFLHETHDSAWRGRDTELSFVGRIGIEDSSNEVLALSPIAKPNNFDTAASFNANVHNNNHINNEDDVYRFNTNPNTNKRNRNIERQAEPPQVEEIESEEEEEPENVDMVDVGSGGGGGGGGKFLQIMQQLQQALPGIDIEDLLKTPAGRAMMAAKLAKLEGSCTLLIPGNIKPSEQQISEQLMKLDEELHNKNDQELLIIDEEKAKSRQKQQEVEAEMEHLQLLLAKETDERIKAEHERKLRELERQRLQEEENLKRLSRMQSLCPAGYAWVAAGSGWRCLGGSHSM